MDAACDLDDPVAVLADQTGTKAANLAAARRAGLPGLPGFVLTTSGHRIFAAAGDRVSRELADLARAPWAALSASGTRPLVVRSSSTVEDVGGSSMAGRFRSILDVRTWDDFLDAVAAVLRSADAVGPRSAAPMAVLVQPQLTAECGGVMFGVDPVTGDRDHIVVEAVRGTPQGLVSGRVTAQHYVLTRRGRVRSVDHQRRTSIARRHRSRAPLLTGRQLRALADMARQTARVFGGPQDVEWAFDAEGRPWLLQSRPVTALRENAAAATGPVLGTGPVAETFPAPLRPLEMDLWVTPLRAGVAAALAESHAVSNARLKASPIVTTVNGRVAGDLELFGFVAGRRSPLRLIDPRPSLRRLSVAWHIGQRRQALPATAATLLDLVDAQLGAVGRLQELSDRDLLNQLDVCVEMLTTLHREEVLAGTLLQAQPPTAASVAISVLRMSRMQGMPDAGIVRRHPVVLALLPPRIAAPATVPDVPAPSFPTTAGPFERAPGRPMGPREALRLRARWVQELSARVAMELGRRLEVRARPPGFERAESIAFLHLAEVRDLVTGGTVPSDQAEREHDHTRAVESAPLPSMFRLMPSGEIAPAARPGARPSGGVGAGGGRGAGRAVHTRTDAVPGEVLVVRDLDPEIATRLPGLAGLVAEAGSTLSHLAILAREYGVPTVVAVHDARHRFPPGVRLLVDGTTGEVTVLDRAAEVAP